MTSPNGAPSNEDFSWGPRITAEKFAGALALADEIPGQNVHYGTPLPGTGFRASTDEAPGNYELFSA